jgi:AcrR family transcriptional regulator
MCEYLRNNIRIEYSQREEVLIMPSGPVLSDMDKNEIKIKLQDLCEHYWTINGYKKTSIKELCKSAGIAIGTFYKFYPTKEDLFFETIENIQKRLMEKFININKSNLTKEGFAQSMKMIFREYDSKPFLYNVSSSDFQSFIAKLPKEAMQKIKFDSIEFFRTAVHTANLNLRIDEMEAYGVLSALLSTITTKETLSSTCDYFVVFDFMVDNLISQIFE